MIAKYSYGRNKDGSVSDITEQTVTVDGLQNRNLTYHYDSLNRLVEESSMGDVAEHNYLGKYSYDLAVTEPKKNLLMKSLLLLITQVS